MIRLRFAPSPTGNLHIGSARTALFNYLLAKFWKGKFILRIEDTDVERSSKEFEADILSGLKWLGIEWDEGPMVGGEYGSYYQMDRYKNGNYDKYCNQLIEEGKAYHCFCTPEDIENEKKQCLSEGKVYLYSGKCRKFSPVEVTQKLGQGLSSAIRFVVNNETIVFKDLVRGEISFDMSLNGDMVIRRSDGMPTYNFAVVIDDMEMKITHVIRGEDHISNTPKQIQIFQALGFKSPEYGHISMILGPDRAKLSKRHGAKSISEFKKDGYLPQAVFNFLALLGWSHPGEKEIVDKNELALLYDIQRVSKSNSIFNIEKLNWLNGQYLRALEVRELMDNLKPFISSENINKYMEEDWLRIIESVRDNLTLLTDIDNATNVFFVENVQYLEENIDKQNLSVVEKLMFILKNIDFIESNISETISDFCKTENIKKGIVFHNLRYAISSELKGPPLFKMLQIFGKDKSIKRLEQYLKYAKNITGS